MVMEIEAAEKYIISRLKNELPDQLKYHSYQHVMDVLGSAERYASMEHLDNYQTQLLRVAVLYHDAGFIIQSKDHEEIGCQLVREVLPDFEFKPLEIEQICGMIMATKIPQSPSNLLEEIICDADLDYLGRDDFWDIGGKLFQELQIFGVLNNEQDWNKLQLKFLSGHQYFTKSAISLRKEKKEQHTLRIKEIVDSYPA